MDEAEEAAEEIEEAPSATPVSTERLLWGCRGPRAAEGVGGHARAESPSSALLWMRRERAGGGGEHNVEGQRDPQVERYEHVHLQREPGEDERRGQELPEG